MKRRLLFAIAVLFSLSFIFAGAVYDFEPLPSAVTQNAVAGVKADGRFYVVSMMGAGPQPTWDAVTSHAYVLDSNSEQWSKTPRDVPGAVGRIGAGAVGAQQQIFLLGGAVPNAQGLETIVSDVDGYEPVTKHWYSGASMPVAVAYAVVGVYRDRFIYVVGGLSNQGPVKNVQVYDIQKNEWKQATPLAGTAVFSHAGAVVGDGIVYANGAEASSGPLPYAASAECWQGKIDHKDPLRIAWKRLPAHPGDATFGIEAGGYEKDHKVYFLGGSAQPHRFNGIGFDGKPAPVSSVAFDFDLRREKWELISNKTPHPRMDGGLLVTPDGLMLVGGMGKDEQPDPAVPLVPKAPVATGQ